jgi:ribonuclease BN (tRNA processing enzyme)
MREYALPTVLASGMLATALSLPNQANAMTAAPSPDGLFMADITQSFSQLLLTDGPGAMLDLPERAVVVAGLQDWRYAGPNWRPVEEERLVALLRQQLGAKLSPTFAGLRHPPLFDEQRRDANGPAVEVRLFPTWFVVDEPAQARQNDGDNAAPVTAAEKRRRIVVFTDLSVSKAGKLSYKGDTKKTEVNPIRFVGACAKGHIQDIDWRFLAHRNGDHSCRKPLYWVERGVSSDPSDISIRCSCGAWVTLGDVYKPGFLGKCSCHSPWLTPRRLPNESCTDDLRLLPRSATNTYFTQTVTVISLTKAEDRVPQIVADHKTTLDGIRSLLDVLRAMPQTKEAFKSFSDDEIATALAKEGEETTSTNINPRVAEFDMLASGKPAIGSDAEGSVFNAETLPRGALALVLPWSDFLQSVVKVHRLREVTCARRVVGRRKSADPTGASSVDRGPNHRCGEFSIGCFPVRHRETDSFGFSLRSPARRHLRPDRLEVLGVPDGPLRRELAQGKQVTLANGSVIDPEEVLGLAERGKKLVIIGDAEATEGLAEQVRDADVLVIEATFLERDASIARDYGHLPAAEAAELAATSDVKQLVLTHISCRYPDEEILAEATKAFPNSRTALDFDRLVI